MPIPHSAPSDTASTAVLVPLRSLRNGKGRLADSVNSSGRGALIEQMALTVLGAAHELDVLVVFDEPDVQHWAERHGAMSLRPHQAGLNAAITEGHAHLKGAGYERVIIAHADLPLASDLRVMLTGHEVVIAPDRHRQGTNVLAVPTSLDFVFQYGPGSFDHHIEGARQLGIEPHIVDDPQLAWDVDEPHDLLDSQIELINSQFTEDQRVTDH